MDSQNEKLIPALNRTILEVHIKDSYLVVGFLFYGNQKTSILMLRDLENYKNKWWKSVIRC